jgi:hypothetical protein
VTDFIVNPRRAPRAPCRCRARVQSGTAQWDAETEDVGPHGCQLVAPAPLPRGAALLLALVGPGVKEPLATRGKVAWVSSQPPWRLGVAFEEAARPATTRWFELLVAARPGLGNFRRIPDRLPVDAMVFLGPPPRFADFSEDEVAVISQVASGTTIATLRSRLEERWPVLQRALFALLSRGVVTVARGAAAHPESWRTVMADLGASFFVEAPREIPVTSYTPPPWVPVPLGPSAAVVQAIELAAAEVTDPIGEVAGPAAPPAAPVPPSLPPLQGAPPGMPPPLYAAPPGAATAGTGWRGSARTRSADAQEAFELGQQELAEGRTKAAMALLRRALQLAPGDAEVAAELGKAMKG